MILRKNITSQYIIHKVDNVLTKNRKLVTYLF